MVSLQFSRFPFSQFPHFPVSPATTDRHYAWIKSYLSNRLQYPQIDENSRSEFCVVKCGVPEGSILGPLLFLLYINDLKNGSSVLDPIRFADDTNFFYIHSNIQKLFSTMNAELASNNQWFTSNKLSLNAKKTKYSFFHKPSKKMTSLLCYQTWLSVIMLLRDKNLSNFSEYY